MSNHLGMYRDAANINVGVAITEAEVMLRQQAGYGMAVLCVHRRPSTSRQRATDVGRLYATACLWRVQVLDRLRGVAGRKGRRIAYLLDTKGPEVRGRSGTGPG
jgi:hypothetical protein